MPEQIRGAMEQILEHLGNCPIALLAVIEAEIEKRGDNRSTVPLALFRGICPDKIHDICWVTTVEVQLGTASFDVEAHDPQLYLSVRKALRMTRRHLTDARRTA